MGLPIATNTALQWNAEDLVSNSHRAYMNGDIDEVEYNSIKALDKDQQLDVLESIFDDIGEYIIETINNDIYGALVDRYNDSKKVINELTNEEIMDRILKLKMTKGIDVRDEIIRLQQIIDERISNN
jgi:hypothetical protein|tara:strand:- start:271 stop:651 length:381 start_codon:yes stop_codon:yes gene_type:complete